jgi:hypothetical protein
VSFDDLPAALNIEADRFLNIVSTTMTGARDLDAGGAASSYVAVNCHAVQFHLHNGHLSAATSTTAIRLALRDKTAAPS